MSTTQLTLVGRARRARSGLRVALGALTFAIASSQAWPQATDTLTRWGDLEKDGFVVAKTDKGPLSLSVYASTSQITGAFNRPHEVAGGANYYPGTGRYPKLDFWMTSVSRSPVSSTFGYYVGGQKGLTFSFSTDLLF